MARTANSSPPMSGDDVRIAEGVLQHLGRLDERGVALLVAGGIVDLLEVVEVDVEQGQLLPRPVGDLHLLLGEGQEAAAVVDLGQLVDEGQVPELVLGPRPLDGDGVKPGQALDRVEVPLEVGGLRVGDDDEADDRPRHDRRDGQEGPDRQVPVRHAPVARVQAGHAGHDGPPLLEDPAPQARVLMETPDGVRMALGHVPGVGGHGRGHQAAGPWIDVPDEPGDARGQAAGLVQDKGGHLFDRRRRQQALRDLPHRGCSCMTRACSSFICFLAVISSMTPS